MSIQYQAVGWNRQKRWIDGTVLGVSLLFLGLFTGITLFRSPGGTIEIILIRGLGLTALLLLHFVLLIGPLSRMNDRFLPLLYNRRHLGVLMFILGLGHAVFALFMHHAMGNLNPLVSVLSANRAMNSLNAFPFKLLGVGALLILFLMAATSHDFWLSILTPPTWKALHMSVYVAYALLVGHVALGVLQAEASPMLAGMMGVGLVTVVATHLLAAGRNRALDRVVGSEPDWIDAGPADTIPESRARMLTVAGDRVAIFRHEGRLSAVSNVCKHQNGPLGEGRIVDGCITCPWHGYQYFPDSGRSPPPYTDTIPTFALRVQDGRVEVFRTPHPPGTVVKPVPIHE